MGDLTGEAAEVLKRKLTAMDEGMAPAWTDGQVRTLLAALREAGIGLYRPDDGWLVECPICEGGGEVLPHDDLTDCDICAHGAPDSHATACPRCVGKGEIWVVPVEVSDG